MNLRFPIRSRLALSLATFALIVLVGVIALSELALSPDSDAEEHSLIYIADCPGTVIEEGPSRSDDRDGRHHRRRKRAKPCLLSGYGERHGR